MTIQQNWHGYTRGSRSTGHEIVRRARKPYKCEGAAIDADSVDAGVALSPGTGSVVNVGWSESCQAVIPIGSLYVASDYAGELARDFVEGYRYTFRTCLTCALHFDVIELVAK